MTKRLYDQYCPVAGALDIIGERWAMLVVRELLSGPKRFVDLEAGLPGIGSNTLATRLGELEAGAVIERRRLPAPSGVTVYELTTSGRDLAPVVHAIAHWGAQRLGSTAPRYPLRATWLAVALQAFFRPDAVKGLTATIELVLPTGTLTIAITRGRLRVTEGKAADPTLRITAGEEDIVALLASGGRSPPGVRIEGDASLVKRIAAAFPLDVSAPG